MDVPRTAKEEEYILTYEHATLRLRVGRKERWMYKWFRQGEQYTDEWITVYENVPVEQVRDFLRDREEDAWVSVTVI